jgi:hypothetical protein
MNFLMDLIILAFAKKPAKERTITKAILDSKLDQKLFQKSDINKMP